MDPKRSKRQREQFEEDTDLLLKQFSHIAHDGATCLPSVVGGGASAVHERYDVTTLLYRSVVKPVWTE